MGKSTIKTGTNSVSMVQLLSKSEASALLGERASIDFLENPTVSWAKFVLTDDKVNGNGYRIPSEEFGNLINTGVNMPVKMAIGKINDGHDKAEPLGVITHIVEINESNNSKALVALAALWAEERPADIEYIKSRMDKKEPVNVSWEILYGDAEYNDAQQSVDLRSVVLRAATLVEVPAYRGRTQFLSIAAKTWDSSYIEALPDSSFLYVDHTGTRHFPVMDSNGILDRAKLAEALSNIDKSGLASSVKSAGKKKILSAIKILGNANIADVSREFINDPLTKLEDITLDIIEQLKAQLAQVELDLANAIKDKSTTATLLSDKETAIAELQEKVTNLSAELESTKQELVPLREFKASLDAEVQKQEKLDQLKIKFSEAGVVKSDEYFVENSEKLLAFGEDTLNFMLLQLKEAYTGAGDHKSDASLQNIPNLPTEDAIDYTNIKALVKAIRDSKAKKENIT